MSRRTGDQGVGVFNGFTYSTLCIDLASISYADMSNNARLAAYPYTITDLGTSAYTCLRSNYRMVSNFYVMRNLYKVIQFGTCMNDGGSYGGSVNRYVSTDLYICFKHHIANLWHFCI